jgi:inward rectifier potassium channel
MMHKNRRPSQRIVLRDGEFPDIVRIGDPHSPWRDPYHLLLTMPWVVFVGLLLLTYLGVNSLFAIAYLAGGMRSPMPIPTPSLTPYFSAFKPWPPSAMGPCIPKPTTPTG